MVRCELTTIYFLDRRSQRAKANAATSNFYAEGIMGSAGIEE
jgi:hypothetical protein